MGDESFSKGVVRIIGTHHFVEENLIRKEIEEFAPDITLIELCNGRITLIEHPELKQKEKFSLLGLIVKAVKKKAEKEGKTYGNDMISAYKISKEKEIPVGLIDRPIVETQVLFKAIPVREKVKLLNELRKFKRKDIKIQDIINEVENTETEEILNKIKAYLYDHPNKRVLIFIGEGHRKTIEKSLKLNAEEKEDATQV